ncbi:aspartate carbamoyltransferase regulatory subunit [Bacteroidota bacterium]
MKDKKHLEVSAIKNGTVIDHIPADSLFYVLSILKLEGVKTMMTFGTNLKSKKLGKKSIIKIADMFFEQDDINRIALVAPQAKLNIIKNYTVVEKMIVEIPDSIVGIAKCFNPKCITNNENVTTRFSVISKSELGLKCHYCEKITNREHLVILK